MGKRCCICQKKVKFLESKIMIAGQECVCELCLKKAGIYKSTYSMGEIQEFFSVTRRDIMYLLQENDEVSQDAFYEIDNARYCSRCNNILAQEDEFCPNCGSHIFQLRNNMEVESHIGEKISGDDKKELELTKHGVRISHKKLQKLFLYDRVMDVEFVKASLGGKGYLSIITPNGGIIGYLNPNKLSDYRTLLLDQNTIIFSHKLNAQADKIYKAILSLKNASEFEDLGDIDDDTLNEREFDSMTGHEFEYFCANLLKDNNFYNVKVTKGSGDQGVDVLAEKDGVKYAIQCKLYSTALGNTPVQEVAAGKTFYGCHVGVVMTNSTFTTGAKELAKATNVLLWDRCKLDELRKN